MISKIITSSISRLKPHEALSVIIFSNLIEVLLQNVFSRWGENGCKKISKIRVSNDVLISVMPILFLFLLIIVGSNVLRWSLI